MLAPEEREREREGERERERERRRREGKVEERRSRRERKEKNKHSNQIGSDWIRFESDWIDKALEHSRIATTLPPLFFFTLLLPLTSFIRYVMSAFGCNPNISGLSMSGNV